MASAAGQLPGNERTQSPAVHSVRPGIVWGFAGVIVLVYFCTLGSFGLAEPDEPRYAEIAREMLQLRDWVTPHLNYVKYFEKPPLIYWLTAVNLQLFGTSELAVRLWPALFGLLGIAMTLLIGRSMYGPWVGCVAAAVLAATPFYFVLSQILILDMPLASLMTVGLGGFWFAYTMPAQRRPLVVLLYTATALAVLTKGPVAVVLTAGVILAFLALRGDAAALRWVLSPLGLCIFVAVAAPWFVLVSWRNREFVDFFIVDQHLRRFLEPSEHQQSLWFFIPIVFGGMLPWTGVALFAPRRVAAFVMRLVQRRTSAAALYCVLWAGAVFIFFSLSGSKLATYVLPMFSPLAILLARLFQTLIEDGLGAPFTRACAALLVLAAAAVAGGFAAGQILDYREVAYVVARIDIGAPLLAAAVATSWVLIRHVRPRAGLAILMLGMLGFQVVAMTGRGLAVEYSSLGAAVRKYARPDDQVILYKHYVQGITFYAKRRVIMVAGRGELTFGSLQGDQRQFFWDSDAELLDAWRSGRRVFLVINRPELEPLRPQLYPPPREIAAHDKKVLLVNFDR